MPNRRDIMQFSRREILRTGVVAGISVGGLGVSHTVAAQNTSGGTKRLEWAFETGSDVDSSPTVANSTVYVGSDDNNLYAVDAGDGTEQWAFETGSEVPFSPTVVDGTVYVGSIDNSLYAVDAATGDEQWIFDANRAVTTSPTVADGIVYVGSIDNNLYAVNSATGDEQWAFETGDYVYSSPTVADGIVYVGSNDNNLYAVDAATGDEQWAFETGDSVYSSPTVADSTVYVGGSDFHLYAVDAATGDEQWVLETNAGFSSPTVVDGTIYVGSDDNNLYAVDADSGDQQWTFEAGSEVDTLPTVVDGTVYVGSNDNNLYAVDAGDTSSSGFDPTVHGFGFPNWDLKEATEPNFPGHNHNEISLQEVRDIIETSWPEKIEEMESVEFPGSGLAIDAIVLQIYLGVNQGTATNGHCYGMTYAAEEYYQSPNQLPSSAAVASDIPDPTGKNTSVGDKIDFYQNSQTLNLSVWTTYQLGSSSQDIDYQRQLEAMMNAIDETGTAGVTLYDSNSDSVHQILATGYTSDENTVEVEVYDPNYSADSEAYNLENSAVSVVFNRTGSHTTVQSYLGRYDRILYSNTDRRVDLTSMLRSEQTREWFKSMLTDVVAFATQSPVDLTVTDVDGNELSRMTAEGMSLEPTEYDHLRTDFGSQASEYEVELTGTNDGEYTLEVQGRRADGTRLSTSVVGEISEGETHRYQAVLPDESGEQGRLESVTDGDGEEGEPTIVGLAAGGAVAGGLGYGLYRRISENEDSAERNEEESN